MEYHREWKDQKGQKCNNPHGGKLAHSTLQGSWMVGRKKIQVQQRCMESIRMFQSNKVSKHVEILFQLNGSSIHESPIIAMAIVYCFMILYELKDMDLFNSKKITNENS